MWIAGRVGVWRLENAILIDRNGRNPMQDDVFLGHGSGRRNEPAMLMELARHFSEIARPALRNLRANFNVIESTTHGLIQRNGRGYHIVGQNHGGPAPRFRIDGATYWIPADTNFVVGEIRAADVPGLYGRTLPPRGQRTIPRVYRPAESLIEA